LTISHAFRSKQANIVGSTYAMYCLRRTVPRQTKASIFITLIDTSLV